MTVAASLTQTQQGKAYEYACMQALAEAVSGRRPVVITDNSSLSVAYDAWQSLRGDAQDRMRLSARAGIKNLLTLEPKILEDGQDELELSLQEDQRGQKGDVRDVLIIRRSINWEIGISVKHNREAVKHSRISPTIDFGRDWLGLANTDLYQQEMEPVFTLLRSLKLQHMKWREIENKDELIYLPLLKAFINEMTRLDEAHPGIVPGRLLEYLLGRKDFYKLIADDTRRTTKLQCFNLHKTLNTPAAHERPLSTVRPFDVPQRIYAFEFKPGPLGASKNTIQLVMDGGWTICFRIHSASTYVETSLKFDITLKGTPSSLFSNTVSW